jgi:lysozyme
MVDFIKLKTELNREEGRRKSAYRDSLGYLTIGVGRLIDARKEGGLSNPEIELLLDNDLNKCYLAIKQEPWFLTCDDVRQRALVDMHFQLGHHLYGFVNTLAALTKKDWKTAANCLRKSLWARQTPVRAARIIGMIENGTG